MARRFQVVIVGGGPVGTALAVDLGQRGVSCAVIERRREVGTIPKGQNLTHRTLEHFYFWKCLDELRNARVLPSGYTIGGVVAYGTLSSEYWEAYEGRSSGSGRTIDAFYFQKNERLPQYLTEEVLRARAEELKNITFFFEWTATAIEHDSDGVRVTAESSLDSDEELVLEGDYLVGCDGGRSLVREQSGIDRHGTDFDQQMVLTVFSSTELHDGLERFGERTTFRTLAADAKGAWPFFGRVDVGNTWFFHGPVARGTTADDLDYLRDVMAGVTGFPFTVEFEHVGFWELRVDVADAYRSGRVFIAGDAAHTHPPYGAFGLNSGLEDVTNLGWKLAGTLAGWGSEPLLASYSEERQPIFWQTGEDVIAAGIIGDAVWTKAHDPERDLAEFEQAWKSRGAGEVRLEYEPHYEGSTVVCGEQGAPIGIHSRHSFAARAGHHVAPTVLSSGENVFDELGLDFALLAFGAENTDVGLIIEAADLVGLPLKVVRDTFEQGRDRYEARLVLVRPDQFVAWSADETPADIEAVLRKVAGSS